MGWDQLTQGITGSLGFLLRSMGSQERVFTWEKLHNQILVFKRSHGFCVENRLELGNGRSRKNHWEAVP